MLALRGASILLNDDMQDAYRYEGNDQIYRLRALISEAGAAIAETVVAKP